MTRRFDLQRALRISSPTAVDRGHQVGEPLQRAILALEGNDDPIRGDQRVQRQQAERRIGFSIDDLEESSFEADLGLGTEQNEFELDCIDAGDEQAEEDEEDEDDDDL